MTKTQIKTIIWLAIVLSVIFAIACLIIVKMNKPSIITPCTFVRTYEVLNVVESEDNNYLFVTLKQYQVDDVETIKLSKALYDSYIVGDNYEFSFQITGTIKNSIKTIFTNSKVLSVNQTSLIEDNQKQDSMCE